MEKEITERVKLENTTLAEKLINMTPLAIEITIVVIDRDLETDTTSIAKGPLLILNHLALDLPHLYLIEITN